MDLYQRPHRRYNPLKREWVLVSPHRNQRPWQGQVERIAPPHEPVYDADCYLCPGNRRQSGQVNPPYQSTFVFDNDFPGLLPDTPQGRIDDAGLLIAQSERGVCRVVCFSPDHSQTLARMTPHQIRPVVDTLAAQYRELLARPKVGHVQVFENRGAMMGCSNPHPHCQIWASETVPLESAGELAGFAEYRSARGSCLLCDYAALEEKLGERVVSKNDSFLAVVPFWALWPFELLVLTRRHVAGLDALSEEERSALASLMHAICAGYDNVFDVSFPYTMGFHQDAHFHGHYYPPLVRSAAIRKFMVGYELLAGPARDLTPESAAERLREAFAREKPGGVV